jgi:surfeit locus 1 family protein
LGTSTLTFRPPWWATAALFAAGSLFVAAGFWQLDRADQKRALFSEYALGGEGRVLQSLAQIDNAEQLRFQLIELRGQYLSGQQILLDNMLHEGKPGYQVLTPLVTAEGTVLVNRGWLAASADRRQLPDVSVDGGERQISARIDRLPRPGIRLAASAAVPESPWPRRLLYPTAAEIAEQLDTRLPDFQLLLSPDQSDGYLRDWRPVVMGPDTHFGYAVQWFAFTVAIAVIYLLLNVKRTA